MGRNSKIDWTEHSWNPFYGCPDDGRRSEGCAHCYARAWAKRCGLVDFDHEIREAAEQTILAPLDPEKYPPGSKVFVCSLSDICHPQVPEKLFRKVMRVICIRADLIWIFLTKRPEGFSKIVEYWREVFYTGHFIAPPFPRNWWFGVTAESQRQADRRVPELLKTPAAVRFVSVEPMLGPVDLSAWVSRYASPGSGNASRGSRLDWVICGCESGAGRRPCKRDWIRQLRDKCRDERVPFFLKQMEVEEPRHAEKHAAAAETGAAKKGAATENLTPNAGNKKGIEKMPVLDGQVWGEYPGE